MPHRPSPIPRFNGSVAHPPPSLSSSNPLQSTLNPSATTPTTPTHPRRDPSALPPRHRAHSLASNNPTDQPHPTRSERIHASATSAGGHRALPPPRFQRKQRPPRVQNILAGTEVPDGSNLGTLTFGPASNWGVGTQTVVSLPMAAVNAASARVPSTSSSNPLKNAPSAKPVLAHGLLVGIAAAVAPASSALDLSPRNDLGPAPKLTFGMSRTAGNPSLPSSLRSLPSSTPAPLDEDMFVRTTTLRPPTVMAPYSHSAPVTPAFTDNLFQDALFSVAPGALSTIRQQPLSHHPDSSPAKQPPLKSALKSQSSFPKLSSAAASTAFPSNAVGYAGSLGGPAYPAPNKPLPSLPISGTFAALSDPQQHQQQRHSINVSPVGSGSGRSVTGSTSASGTGTGSKVAFAHQPEIIPFVGGPESDYDYEYDVSGAAGSDYGSGGEDEPGQAWGDAAAMWYESAMAEDEADWGPDPYEYEYNRDYHRAPLPQRTNGFLSVASASATAPRPVASALRASPPYGGNGITNALAPVHVHAHQGVGVGARGRPVSTLSATQSLGHGLNPHHHAHQLRSRSRSPSPAFSGNGSCESMGSVGSVGANGQFIGSYGSSHHSGPLTAGVGPAATVSAGTGAGHRASVQSVLSRHSTSSSSAHSHMSVLSNNTSMSSLISRSTISSGPSLRTAESFGSLRSQYTSHGGNTATNKAASSSTASLFGDSIWAMDKVEADIPTVGGGAGAAANGAHGALSNVIWEEQPQDVYGTGYGLAVGAVPQLEPFGAFEPTPATGASRRRHRHMSSMSGASIGSMNGLSSTTVPSPLNSKTMAVHALAHPHPHEHGRTRGHLSNASIETNPFASLETLRATPPQPHHPHLPHDMPSLQLSASSLDGGMGMGMGIGFSAPVQGRPGSVHPPRSSYHPLVAPGATTQVYSNPNPNGSVHSLSGNAKPFVPRVHQHQHQHHQPAFGGAVVDGLVDQFAGVSFDRTPLGRQNHPSLRIR